MAHPNETVVRRTYEAFSAGDIDTLASLLTSDAVWHVAGRSALAGDYAGVDAILGYFAALDEATGGTYVVDEVHDVLANDAHAVGIHKSTITKDGDAHHFNELILLHFSGGKISEAWEHTLDPYEYDQIVG